MSPHGISGRSLDRIDAAIAGGGFVVTLAVLVRTAPAIGYARDEGFYFLAAEAYGRWLRALWADPAHAVRADVVDAHWVVNHEHPPLVKALFALSHELLGGLVAGGTAFRLPAMVLVAALVALLYLWGTRVAGRVAGVVAAASLLAMPRVFFHAHLACFDAPVTALFTATTFAWWRALETRGWRWPLACALLFGATLAAKHNAWFLPFLFAAHGAVVAAAAWAGREAPWPAVRRALAVLGLSLVVGPLVLWASWPWIWRDTAARVGEYVAFHLHHEFYNMELFGETYWRPPFPRTYAPVMTLATVPATTLLLAATGGAASLLAVARAVRARVAPLPGASPEARAWIRVSTSWIGGVLVSYGPWVRDSTPIFGGTKHWMTAMPFLALLAGVGCAMAVRAARRAAGAGGAGGGWRTAALGAALAACAIAPGVVTTARAHPWGLTAYTPLVGGAPGSATLGLNRTFWGYTTASAGPWLAEHAPADAAVYVHDTLGASWDQMQRDGVVPGHLRRVGSVAEADVALQHHEMHMQGQEYQAWIALGTTRPALVLGPDGVPVLLVYTRAARPR